MSARRGSDTDIQRSAPLVPVKELELHKRYSVVLEIINGFRNTNSMSLYATDYSRNEHGRELYFNSKSCPAASEVLVFIPGTIYDMVTAFQNEHRMITSCYIVVTNALIKKTTTKRPTLEVGIVEGDTDVRIYTPSEMQDVAQQSALINTRLKSLLHRKDLLLNGTAATSIEDEEPKLPNRPSLCTIAGLKDNTNVEIIGQILHYERYEDSIKLWVTDYALSGNKNKIPKDVTEDFFNWIQYYSLFIVIRYSYFQFLDNFMVQPAGRFIRFHNLKINTQPDGRGKIGFLNVRDTSLKHDISEVEFLAIDDRRCQEIRARRLKLEQKEKKKSNLDDINWPDGIPRIYNHDGPQPVERPHVSPEPGPSQANETDNTVNNATNDTGEKRPAPVPLTPEKLSKVPRLSSEDLDKPHNNTATIYSHFFSVSEENIIPIKEIKETIDIDRNRKLVVKGKIVDYLPKKVIETVQNYNGMCTFRFLLLIQDKSGAYLPVIYSGDGIVDLFGLSASMAAMYGFQKYSSLFDKLTSLKEEIELCIYEYHTPDDKSNKKLTRWRGLGTRLNLT